jgi:hypothetical protein
MTVTSYSHLADLVGGWFHQDYDIEGETVADVINAFRAVTPPDQQAALCAEITAFLDEYSARLDEEFQARFQPDVTPATLSGSTRTFLEEIRGSLMAA